jgi:hypothetical protein
VTKVGITVMMQKESNNRRSGRAHNHQEQVRSSTKSMLMSFQCEGVGHHESVPPNTTVNSDLTVTF